MPQSLARKLRDTIADSGISLRTIAIATGVGLSTLSEFMAGADMRLSNATKIANYLGLELKRRK